MTTVNKKPIKKIQLAGASEDSLSRSSTWNYHPTLPMKNSSIFNWPPSPSFLFNWLLNNWLTLSERILLVFISILLWKFCYPNFDRAQTFSFEWGLQTYAINFLVVLTIAGLLHWYFYMRKGQGDELKFDRRGMGEKSKLWSFSNQVHDNMFWSLGSGVVHLTAFMVITMWLMANGYAPTITATSNTIWFVLSLILLPIFSAFHFYWVHRLLHVPLLYKRVHSLHHRNVSVGPWSGLAMHPIEHFLYISSLCIHWIVPSDPILVIFHVLWLGPGAAMTHTGYEDLLIKDKRRLALGTFYHQLHHRYYECNYGNQEMPWDRWFGTLHDGSEHSTTETRKRKVRMHV